MTILIEVAAQFASRPTLRDVASRVLRETLAAKFRLSALDPEVALVRVPEAAGTSMTSLTDSLLRTLADQSAPGWTSGQAWLQADPTLPDTAAVDIDIAQLSATLETLSFGLLDEYAQALADYWSAPGTTGKSRWQWLADRLQRDLAHDLQSPSSPGLEASSRDALHTVAMFADKSRRDFILGLPTPDVEPLSLTAGILHFRISYADMTASLPFPAMVLLHSQGDRTRLTAWRPNGDVHRAAAVDDLVAAVCAEMAGQWAFDQVDWTLREAPGNIFHDLTQAILGRQLSDIRSVQGAVTYDLAELEHYLAAVTDVCSWLEPSTRLPGPDPVALPGWLRDAPIAEKLRFSQGLTLLAAEQSRADGKAFNDDLPPILEFATQALVREMRRDHPAAGLVDPRDLEIVIEKVVGAAIASGGQLVAAGSVEPVSMTLPEFALNNLCSLPPGRLSVRRAKGQAVPAWLTPEYLKALVTRIDIGATYPALIRRLLVDDAEQLSWRRGLFSNQLRLQLPLKALEQKFKGEGRMSTAGCDAVAALMEKDPARRRTAGQTIVLRPLAFLRRPGEAADVAANMFVIGPSDAGLGPHVLYRPFSAVVLNEFASWTALLDSIARPGALQDEVLVWLSDEARPIYANGGFLEPHILRFGMGSDFAPLERPAPAMLATDVSPGDPLSVLFDANAHALITLADRDSVSNVESRWAIFKEGGWAVLNALLPLVGGPVANAAWLVQLLLSVQRLARTPADADPQRRSSTLADLLLNISMLLLHQRVSVHALAYRQFAMARTARGASGAHAQVNEVAVEDVEPVLDFSWSNPLNQLDGAQRANLQALRVATVPPLQPLAGADPQAGLFTTQGRVMVRIGGDLYRVEHDEDGYYIVHPLDSLRRGPRIVRNGDTWRLDLRLHLRGGGPKKRARELAEQNAATLKRVQDTRAALGRRRDELYKKMDVYNVQLSTATEEVRALFLARYDSDLREALETVRQRGALVDELRPGDRPSERELGADLKDIASRVRYLEAMIFKDITDIAKASVLAMRSPETGDAVVPGNVDAYMEMFGKLATKQQKGGEWATVRESLWKQLRELPKAGDGYWRAEVLDFERTNLPSLLEWKFMQLFSFLELSFSREDMLQAEAYKPLKDLRISVKLYDAMASHTQLGRPNSYTLAERIDVLESVLREYDRAIEIVSFVRESDFLEHRNDYLERFIGLFQEVRLSTESQLTALIQENTDPPALPVERVPHQVQPRKKVIRTRDRRVLVADIRGEPGELEGEVVDVHDPMTQRVINSWHRHADGAWSEVEPATPSRPAPRPVPRGELRQRASTLLAQVDHAIASAWRQSTRAFEPEDMEDILTQRAARLTELADALGEADGGTLATDLRQAATRLTEQGRAVRIDMIKRQPPTAARLSYLHRQEEIDIARVDARSNLSGARRDDFLQEYSIRDRHDLRLLWWAHFHYASEDAPASDFTAAHLKLPEQRMLGYKALVRAAKDNQAVVAIYRSAIGKEVAQRLFLPLAR